jgi:hypothetical protein
MPQRKHKPEEIVAKLRQVDVLLSQGRPVAEAIRTIVSALSIPYAARLDDCWKRQGMSSSIRLWGWPSRIARRVSAT